MKKTLQLKFEYKNWAQIFGIEVQYVNSKVVNTNKWNRMISIPRSLR